MISDTTIALELLAIVAAAAAAAFLLGRLIERRTQAALRSLTPRGAEIPHHDPTTRIPFRTIRGGKSC